MSDFGDWNPMKEAYHHESNSFNKVLRDSHSQPFNTSYRKYSTKLYVTNIPESFDVPTLTNICSKYGQVTDVFISQNRHFGGITFENEKSGSAKTQVVKGEIEVEIFFSQMEMKVEILSMSASDAMTGLNDNSDYPMKATFFKDKTSTDNMHKRYQQYHPVHNSSKVDADCSISENGRQKSQSADVHSETRSSYRSFQSNSYSGNHVAPAIMKTSSRRVSNSQSDMELKPIPSCVNCTIRTLETCMKCRVSYCTKKCMVLGFQHHKDVCITIAPHSTDHKSSPSPERSITSSVAGPLKFDTARLSHVEAKKEVAEFPLLTQDYLQNQTTSSSNNAPSNGPLNISNSYDNDDLTAEISRYKDDLLEKKSLSTVSRDVAGRGEAASSLKYDRSERKPDYSEQQREKENRPPYSKNYNESRTRNESTDYRSDVSNSQNHDRKVDSRARDGGKRSSYASSRNDENKSGEFRQKRDSDTGSRYESWDRNESGENRSYDAGSGNSRYGSRDQNDKRKYDDRSDDHRNESGQNRSYDADRGNSRYGNRDQNDKRKYDDRSSNHGNESGQNRSYNAGGNSRYGDRDQNDKRKYDDQSGDHRHRRPFEGKTTFKEAEKSNSALNEDQIAFDSTPPKFSEKKRPTSESTKKPDSRIRTSEGDCGIQKNSDDGATGETGALKRQSSSDSKQELEYIVNHRRSFTEGEKLEVRLKELVTDTPDFCSIGVVEEESLLPKMMAELMRETSLPTLNLKPMAKCLVFHDDERIRGNIVSISPLTVKYIDMGGIAHKCDEQRLGGCPEKYQAIRPFAYKVKFLNAKEKDLEKLENDKKIFEILIKKKTKELVWEAEILASNFTERLEEARQTRALRNGQAPSGESNKTQTRTSSNDQSSSGERSIRPKLCDGVVLNAGIPIELFVTYIEENGEIFYLSRQDVLLKMQTLIKDHKDHDSLDTIGMEGQCLARLEDEWYRARIVETNPLKVYFMDFGNTETVKEDDLKQIPCEFRNDEQLAIKAKLVQGKPSEYNIGEYESHLFKPIQMVDADNVWIVTPCEWIKVVILLVLSKSEYYVIKESDLSLVEQISNLPFTPLKSEPKVGSIYLTEYEDSRWRAELLKVSPPTVKYVDFGNEEVTKLDQLYELPSEWKKRDPMAFKISLSPEIDQLEENKHVFIREEKDNVWKVRQ